MQALISLKIEGNPDKLTIVSSIKHRTMTSKTKHQQARAAQKEATRHKILMSALQLVKDGRSPNELGLREVARAAGMAAPSIYNHFSDMDELGLELIDFCLSRLRSVARSAKKSLDNKNIEQAIHELLNKFLISVNQHETMLKLLIMQWFNPNPEYRQRIRLELSLMRQDFEASLIETAKQKGIKRETYSLESDAVFSLLITFILNTLDLDESKTRERLAILEQQILMIFMGGRHLFKA